MSGVLSSSMSSTSFHFSLSPASHFTRLQQTAMLVLLPAPAWARGISTVSRAARERQVHQRGRVLMEHLLEHPVQFRVLFFEQLRGLEEILRQHRKEFMFVRICVTTDVGVIPRRMGKFPCNIFHPVLNGLPGNLGRQPVSASSNSTRCANSWIPTLPLVDAVSNPASSDGLDRIITPRICLSPTMPRMFTPAFPVV